MPDMASAGSDPLGLTISNCATRCHGSFQQCLVKAASIHAREEALIENQLAKYSLWTAYFQVFGSGRESLDYRLRESFDVQDAIIGVVEALNYSVLKCRCLSSESLLPFFPRQGIFNMHRDTESDYCRHFDPRDIHPSAIR